jgi:hypothetical protein
MDVAIAPVAAATANNFFMVISFRARGVSPGGVYDPLGGR